MPRDPLDDFAPMSDPGPPPRRLGFPIAPPAAGPTAAPAAPHAWGIREQTAPRGPGLATAIPPRSRAPASKPGTTARAHLGASTRRAAAVAVAVIALCIKVGIGFATGDAVEVGASRVFHPPAEVAGAPQGTNARVAPMLAAFQDNFASAAVENAPSVARAYLTPAGRLSYALVFRQDDSGQASPRVNSALDQLFPNVQSSTDVTTAANGITTQCGTVVDPGRTYQACSWYNANAFGVFVDVFSTSPRAAATVVTPVLTGMLKI